VLLAAGPSRRFGGPKLLAPFRGRPLLSYSCEAVARAREAGLLAEAWAVVAAGDDAVRSLVERAGCAPVANPHPDHGMAASIRLGVEAAGGAAELGAVLVLLGDQPLVQVDTMRRLIEAWRNGAGPVVRPRYADQPGTPGHPVLLDRTLWTLAGRAAGDRGLAALLPTSSVIDVPGANPDVDTRDDLRQLEDPSR
jgi:CTP:molybdopterin cytidylyltransferase MocA